MVDNPNHTIFECPQFEEDRQAVNDRLGRNVCSSDVEWILCGDRYNQLENEALRRYVRQEDEELRREFTKMVTSILTTKEAEERTRQEAERTSGDG